MRGRVNGEYASICAALHVSVHSTSAFIDGSFEDFGFPTVQESGVEAVSRSVAVGEHERLFGVQSMPCEGVKLGGVPVDLDLDLGKGHGVRRVCTLSAGCEGNVGFVILGIKILWEGSDQWSSRHVEKWPDLAIPAAWEYLSNMSSFLWMNTTK